MITLIKESDHQKMPRKPAGHHQPDPHLPKGSSLAKLDFDYRLSSAPIKSAGPFSPFPGYQRILLPVSGAGFVLNGHPYATFEAAHFSGDEETHCELLKKEVTDLGLIYHPDRISANVRVLNLPFPLTLTLEPEDLPLSPAERPAGHAGQRGGHQRDAGGDRGREHSLRMPEEDRHRLLYPAD